ncbi:MAG: hypothetical protein PHQ40_17190 [Anaerolineaceae bacterium]|nr:hypothetical protein [Anaerolineaceae bacterium]
MPDLSHTLQDRDLGFLRIVAARWGIDLTAPDARTALEQLVAGLSEEERGAEMLEALPAGARLALEALQREGGRLPWLEFTRTYGAVREMGPARRDRERPDLHPVSVTESLWYRVLLARGFFDTPKGPLEFAYIPDELIALLPSPAPAEAQPPGCPAAVDRYAQVFAADDSLLDQACTLLAALRLNIQPPPGPAPADALRALLVAAGLIDANGAPAIEASRLFLEAARADALVLLFQAWQSSPHVNELRLLPGLSCEGEWRNDPVAARHAILGWVQQLPARTWWDLDAMIAGIRERQPDFQRTAGEYDSWFIRQESTGQYLRGFAHWNAVEGELVRYLVTGPLHWLGAVDLGAPDDQTRPAAFRLSAWAADLFTGAAPRGLAGEEGLLQVLADGRIRIPRLAPRAVRYQVARFCAWEDGTPGEYRYRITPASLERARKQGLRVSHLLSLLRRTASAPPTPNLVRALEHWDDNGTQADFEQVIVLRVKSPEILAALRKSRAARFLGDPLGPAAVIVKAGAREKVLQALVELGYLAEAGFNHEKIV